MLEFSVIAAALLSQAHGLLSEWFPAGQVRGHEYVLGSVSGDRGDSLSINMQTGKWADFASDEKGGDLISLYAAKERVSQGEAAKRLERYAGVTAAPVKTAPRRRVVMPAPEGSRSGCHHSQYGAPSRAWEYRDRDGRLNGYVARYDVGNGKKEILPWTLGSNGVWAPGFWPDPRPLYGLDDLAKRPSAPVMVVEGEKCAEAARKVALAYVVVTWPGGANSWNKADWSPLHGRQNVLLWPDADDRGEKAMSGLGKSLLKFVGQIKVLRVDEMPEGWDVADAIEDGWTWERIAEWAAPRASVLEGGGQYEVAKPQSAPRSGVTGQSEKVGAAAEGLAAAPSGGGRVAKWLQWGLDRTGNGDPMANLNNAVLVLEHDPTRRGLVWYDEFLDRLLTAGPDGKTREWKDYDDTNLQLYMQREIGLSKISSRDVSAAVVAVAYRDIRNCVAEWLRGLAWDGVPRIDSFFEDHFGADATAYVKAASRNFWLSLVARALRPGCKVDNMIVLEGAQGVGKSRALALIGGEWFAEQHESASNPKGFGEILQGKWLVEISEMDAFGRAEVTRVKAAITSQVDRFRGSYKHYAEDHPRRCVFVGTTNKDDWNRDETGGRRYWPIRCVGEIDCAAIGAAREQLFAEAVVRFNAGELWWEMPGQETRQEQAERYQEDVWQEPIWFFLTHERFGESWIERDPRPKITILEVLIEGLGFEKARIDRVHELRVGACLRVLGYEKVVARVEGRLCKIWKRSGSLNRIDEVSEAISHGQ